MSSTPPSTRPLLSVVVVPDEPLDESEDAFTASVLEQEGWQEGLVELVVPTAQDPAAARDEGVARATGEWLTHADPRDTWAPGFLAAVVEHLAPGPDVALVLTELWQAVEGAEPADTQSVRTRMRGGPRTTDLARDPRCFPTHAGSTFVRLDDVRRLGLRHDPALSSTAWDRAVLGAVLVDRVEDDPRVLVLGGARYVHRPVAGRRDPLRPAADPRDLVVLPRDVLLPLLRRAHERHGLAPDWLQELAVHDLAGWCAADLRGRHGDADPDLLREHADAVRAVLALVERSTVWAYDAAPLGRWARLAMCAVQEAPVRPTEAVVGEVDVPRRLFPLVHVHTGPAPREVVRRDGARVLPVFAKTRGFRVWGDLVLHERTLWLPLGGTYSLALDDEPVVVRPGPAGDRAPSLDSSALLPEPGVDAAPRRAVEATRSAPPASLPHRVVRRLRRGLQGGPGPATSTEAPAAPAASPYRDAWVLMDRAVAANDSAEHLYRHLLHERPDVNAFFVLDPTSRDWDRLAAEGFRLVAFRSPEHRALLREAVHVASTHIDPYVLRPFADEKRDRHRWSFTFLQHGVTKDDISAWVNPKRIDLFVTATSAEHASIVADDSPYRYGERETVLTGFPRHDGLLRKDAERDREPHLLAVMPTWRQRLAVPMRAGQTHHVPRADILDTDFGRAWLDVLTSPELAAVAERAGLEVALLAHPNLAGAFTAGVVGPHVRVLGYDTHDVQEVLAATALLVTDYSSQAFEAAFLQRPTVYHQFDRAGSGVAGHFYQPGWFDYERDGFGPVVGTAAGVAEAAARLVGPDHDPDLLAEYRRRATDAFPWRDGRACERVVEAMTALRTPVRG